MASSDLETFVQECLRNYDPNIDLTAGSAAQQAVVQPLLRRLGADPFTMSLEKFVGTRLAQEFPDLNVVEGDALMDMLVKPARVLLEPMVQEIKRVRDNLSVANADTMTLAEADALGANLFAERDKGDFARVTVRLYYAAPQNSTISPSNYVYTGGNLRFYPVMIQSITTNQMLFNKEGGYYYFDIATVAEKPGASYSVGPRQVIGIYGVPAVVKITNKLAASAALDEETAVAYLDRLGEDLTERSLVTAPGILAVRRKFFPTIQRVAVVGMGDPEMQRDILQGAGIGPILAAGQLGAATPDGSGVTCILTVQDSIDFTKLVGPVGSTTELFTMTLQGNGVPGKHIADYAVRKVLSATSLELVASDLTPWSAVVGYSTWALRKNILTLSGVLGGTAVEGENGKTTVEGDKVHVGGMVDIYVTAATLDQGTLTLAAVTDESPELSGIAAKAYPSTGTVTGFELKDLVLGTSYTTSSAAFKLLDTAKDLGLTLQILGGDAGSYRIVDVLQEMGSSPILLTDPAPVGYPLAQNWRLLGKVDVDLSAPKDVRISGTDLFTVQGNALAQVPGVADLSAYGVVQGDVLEILAGADAGTYAIADTSTTNQLRVDRAFSASTAGVAYRIYRRLSSSSLSLPLVRVSDISLLDSSGQNVGIPVPYAAPVGVQAFDFTTPTNALLVDINDALIGCVGKPLTTPSLLNSTSLRVTCPLWDAARTITFTGVTSVADAVSQANTQLGEVLASAVGDRLALSPFRGLYTVTAQKQPTGSELVDAFPVLFDTESNFVSEVATNMVRSATMSKQVGGWSNVRFDIEFDTVQVLSSSGVQFTSRPRSEQSGKVITVLKDMAPAVGALVRIGPRAVGRVRCFFLDPTTFEATSYTYENPTRFIATLGDGTELGFVTDPTVDSLRYPPPPSANRATDGTTAVGGVEGGTLTSATVDFLKKQILPGDQLVLDYVPIISDKARTETIVGLALKTLIFQVEGVERTMVFSGDVANDETAVTLEGAIAQICRILGAGVARFNTSNFLEFEPSYALTIVGGTAAGFFWQTFSTTYPQGVSNFSSNYNGGYRYTIWHVAPHELRVLENLAVGTRQQFRIYRPGAQRVGTTQMALNKSDAGMYYADIQVVSEGSGAIYNLASGTALRVENFKALGYTLSAENKHLTYSVAERPWLHITPTLIGVGSSDDPEMAIQVAGQNLQISYDWSADAAAFQNFVLTAKRVLTANILVRHLLPHYVRFDLTYQGSPTVSEVKQNLQLYVQGLQPEEVCAAADLRDRVRDLGASRVQNEIRLMAVVHQEDRSLRLEQSTDHISYNRLAGFFADQINVTKTG